MTDSKLGYPAQPDDPLASQRAELLGRLAAAQFDLEQALSELAGSGADTVTAEAQLQNLGAMMRQIGSAGPSALMGLRAEVGAAVAQTATMAQQTRTAASISQGGNLADLASTSRRNVDAVMQGMADFDADLSFANAEEEAAYRRREAERRAYVEAEQKKGTPQGDLNASGAAVGQMADAAAHGAADSPAFQQRWDALVESTQKLRAQLIREGKDVSEFDRRLRDDLREIMRAKGVPDAQIDALLAAHPDNPLEAAKAFVADGKVAISDREIGQLAANAGSYKDRAEEIGSAKGEAVTAASSGGIASALDAMAGLKAMGVVTSEHDVDAAPSHGVADQLLPAFGQGRDGRF